MREGQEPLSGYRGSQAAISAVVIVTEKPSVSQAICRALLKDGEDPRLYGCTDTFRVASSGRGNAASGPQLMYFEYGQTALQRLPLEVASLKQFKGDPATGRLAPDRREGRVARQGDVEKVTFYILEAAGMLVLVLDTNGNPLNLSFPRLRRRRVEGWDGCRRSDRAAAP